MAGKLRKLFIVPLLLLALLLSCTTVAKDEVYVPHTALQRQALMDWRRTTLIVNGSAENSRPEKLVLSVGKSATSLELISLSGDSVTYSVDSGKVELDNLFIGESYSWTSFDKEGKEVKKGSFLVSPEPPRNICIDGVTNVRDLGGWISDDGEPIKQGMLYRSARLSENKNGDALVTEEGRRVINDVLAIKTELDLRKTSDNENGGITASPAGDGVNYISLPFLTGGGYLQKNLQYFPALFEILANEENYPILFHCSIGTDRTGAVAFVLGALLGMDRDDLYRDYLFSNFGYIEGMRRQSTIDEYLLLLGRYNGATLSEKARTMLIENGVKEEDIDSFLRIMEKK